MTPRRYGPLAYVPIHRRPPLIWPNGAHVALWVNPPRATPCDAVPPGQRVAPCSLVPQEAKFAVTRRWREPDSNHRFRGEGPDGSCVGSPSLRFFRWRGTDQSRH